MTVAPQIRSRRPTGQVPWPVILVEGGEKSGKSYSAALLSASARVGRTFWVDLGEGSADEYGAIPGVRYEVIEHDGTFLDILGQVRAVKAEARRASDAQEPPTVLVIDTISDVWEGLKNWASERARQRRKLGPDVEVTVSMDLWNDSGSRYRRLMTELLTFPGIVILLARGKEVAALDDNGKPIERQKDYRVEGHKTLAYDATMWVRMSRSGKPQIIGARSVHAGIRPGRDEPKDVKAAEAERNLLEWLIFTALRCDPEQAHVRDIKATTGGELTAEERGEDPSAAQFRDRALDKNATQEDLRRLYDDALKTGKLAVPVMDETGEIGPLGKLIIRKGNEISSPPAIATGRAAEQQQTPAPVPNSVQTPANMNGISGDLASIPPAPAANAPLPEPAPDDLEARRRDVTQAAIRAGFAQPDGTLDFAALTAAYEKWSGGSLLRDATVGLLQRFAEHLKTVSRQPVAA
ncbi:AAA family ATPase [Frankia sp. R82]|uniref:AAA family ATPase n=1 Tax=Frankia sp. R82 TaxID=2950553 RepID=UPI002043F46D|nr:AAA family ATPase [Frankia sp. R82]MCM3884179.1 ATP-binding protein [Frankia sp. R82]